MSIDVEQPAATQASGLARGWAWALLAVSGLLFVVLAWALVPWEPVPGGVQPARATDVFTAEQIALAEEYSTGRRYLGWASYAVSLLVALVLGFTTRGARLVRRVAGGRRWWLAVPLGTLALLVVGRLATLPFAIAVRDRNLEYGLTTQAWSGWAADYAKSLLVSWVLTSLVLLVVVGAARRSPRYWFAWAGGLAAALALAGSFLYPVAVEPLFNRFTSMPAGPFKASVFRLAEAEGVEIEDVLVSDASRRTTTLNAYVSGYGGTRRVVVYDNLINELGPKEARVVIAHELAHAKHDDVLVGTSLGAVGGVFGVALLALLLDARWVRRRAGVSGPADPAAVAVILALAAVGTLAASPVQGTISRAVETRADLDSIAATGEGDVFVDMQRQLAIHSLSDPTPPRLSHFWFASHPTVLERAALPDAVEEAGE